MGWLKGNSEINYWLYNVYIVFSRRSVDEVTTSPPSQEVNSAFVRYLDDGYWYLSFYNDGPKSQNIRYLLLLLCDSDVLIVGVYLYYFISLLNEFNFKQYNSAYLKRVMAIMSGWWWKLWFKLTITFTKCICRYKCTK